MSSNLCLIAASLVANGQAPGWQLTLPPPSIAPSHKTFRSSGQVCPSKANFVQAKAIPPSPNSVESILSTATVFSTSARTSARTNSSDSRYPVNTVLDLIGAIDGAPMTNRQLFFQRVAALRAGVVYTKLTSDSFRREWENVVQTPDYQQWLMLLDREAQMMAAGQGKNRLTVLLGDTHALWFPSKYLSKDQYWLNQGIANDTTADVLDRIDLFKQTRPSTIHVMVGINDLRQGKTDEEILTNIRLIMRKIQQNHPQAQIFVYSILPTRLEAIPSSRIRWLNYNIATYSKREGVRFLNLQPALADATGQLRRTYTTDGVHLNSKGYAAWQVAAAPIL